MSVRRSATGGLIPRSPFMSSSSSPVSPLEVSRKKNATNNKQTLKLVYVGALVIGMLVIVQLLSSIPYEQGPRPTPKPTLRSKCYKLDQQILRCKDNNLGFPTDFGPKGSSHVQCGFDAKEDIEYLPDPEFFECIKARPWGDWEHDANEFYTKIHQLQNPESCSDPRSADTTTPVWTPGKDSNGEFMKIKGEPSREGSEKWHLVRFLKHGWAYNLYVFAMNVGNHWSTGVPVLISNSKYRYSDINCGRGWSCLFSPLSKCSVEDVEDQSRILVYGEIDSTAKNVMTMDQICKPYGTYNLEYGRCECGTDAMPSRDTRYPFCSPMSSFDFSEPRILHHKKEYLNPDPKNQYDVLKGDSFHFMDVAPGEANPGLTADWVHDKKNHKDEILQKWGFFWKHAHVLWYLHKDAPLRPQLDQYLKSMGISPDEEQKELGENFRATFVGVHIRHGDSCYDQYQSHRKCLPLKDYMERVKKLEMKYGKYDKVYLATDDPEVIKDTKDYPDYTFVFQAIERAKYAGKDHNGVDGRKDFNKPNVVMEISRDLWALAHCDAFVGSMASSVAWVALELNVARRGHYVPFISVDYAFFAKENVGRFRFITKF